MFRAPTAVAATVVVLAVAASPASATHSNLVKTRSDAAKSSIANVR